MSKSTMAKKALAQNTFAQADEKVFQHLILEATGASSHSSPNYCVIQFCDQNRVRSLLDLTILEPDHLRDLPFYPFPDTYKPGDTTPEAMYLGTRASLITCLQAWVIWLSAQKGQPLEVSEYLSLTRLDFQTFSVMEYPNIHQSRGQPTLGSTAPRRSLADEFNRSVKKDKTMYNKLTKEEDFAQWNRTFRSQARQHNLDWILDDSIQPSTPEDLALFSAQQRFAYTVFEHTLQTDTGKALLRTYEDDKGTYGNAQALYAALLKHHNDSAISSIKAAQNFGYLANIKYTSDWSLGAYQFLLYWDNTAKQYNDLKKKTEDLLSEGNKLELLQLAVMGVHDLRNVKTFVEANCRRDNAEVTF